ncbi:hypothetical protein ColLi_12190 [Colletotrichum liriopes]|uniref:Uncharacterized protein n=1 Tax=Colletotrichum liriopes TaxID=708192 RepID=A0AA37LYF3_9PEZI|nr:hypothetical protein ColLi_12190 [Colletotrichum liriopes]
MNRHLAKHKTTQVPPDFNTPYPCATSSFHIQLFSAATLFNRAMVTSWSSETSYLPSLGPLAIGDDETDDTVHLTTQRV